MPPTSWHIPSLFPADGGGWSSACAASALVLSTMSMYTTTYTFWDTAYTSLFTTSTLSHNISMLKTTNRSACLAQVFILDSKRCILRQMACLRTLCFWRSSSHGCLYRPRVTPCQLTDKLADKRITIVTLVARYCLECKTDWMVSLQFQKWQQLTNHTEKQKCKTISTPYSGVHIIFRVV